ncbi:hypothetical protein CLOM_g17574 [Closterium sp. NIES-68]|nr:hypothetical protein CLOM_g17574 [Closterium sp. NIES-68]GJP86662.1 hypothetical protein CLOP_g16658 [Closterium sp. NIES-67]
MKRFAFENIDPNHPSQRGSERESSSKIPAPTTASKLLPPSHLMTPCTPRLSFAFAHPPDTLSKPGPSGPPRRLSLMPPASSTRSSMCPAPPVGRQSLAGGKGAIGSKADPRPISSKAYQARCAESVLEYLLAAGFDRSVNRKVLAMPSSKDFFRMAEFLLARIDPRFKLGAKPDDDLVAALKWVGYPFSISKNALHSVGTPHTWPPLLAMLHWLVQLLNYHAATTTAAAAGRVDDAHSAPSASASAPGGAVNPIRRMFAEQVRAGYRVFMSEEDDAAAEAGSHAAMEEFVRRSDAVLDDVRRRIAQKQERVQRLQEQVRQAKGPSRLEAVVARRAAVVKEVGDAERRAAQARAERKELEAALAEKRAELEERRRAAAAKKAENARLRAAVEAQGVTATEVERMMTLKTQREEARRAVMAARKEAEKEAWAAEVEVARLVAQVEAGAHEFNALAARRMLVPETAKRAHGMQYDVSVNPRADTWADMLGDRHPKADIRAGLAGVRRAYEEKRALRERQVAEAEAQVEQAQSEAKDARAAAQHLEKMRTLMEQDEREEILMRQKHMEAMVVKVSENERRVRQVEQGRSDEISHLEHHLKVAVAESRAERRREVEEMAQALQRVTRVDGLLQVHEDSLSHTVAVVEESCNRETLQPLPE